MRRIEPKTLRLALGLSLGLPLAAAFAACSPTAPNTEEIQATFKEVVDAAKDCDDAEQASQCVLVYPGCPLGQFEAVRRDQAIAVDEAARALLRQYARKDQVCAYTVIEEELAPDARCNRITSVCEVCHPNTNDCPEPNPDGGQ